MTKVNYVMVNGGRMTTRRSNKRSQNEQEEVLAPLKTVNCLQPKKAKKMLKKQTSKGALLKKQ